MKVFNNFIISKTYKKSSLAIGNFDGVHKGHQKVFKHAKKTKLKFGILTFTPLPVMFFNKKIKNHRINNIKQKTDQLKKLKVDFLNTLENYGSFRDYTIPFSHILYSYLNPFSNNLERLFPLKITPIDPVIVPGFATIFSAPTPI